MWDEFYRLFGRYVAAAGNAEWMMLQTRWELERLNRRPRRPGGQMWSGLVRALQKEAEGGAFEERVNELLKDAERRGRLRNDLVHSGWYVASETGYMGRRQRMKDTDPATLLLERESFTQSLRRMEWFRDELEQLLFDVTRQPRKG